jgi:peptidoglycan/xylan/chitin deacetylase (PgdA/CDA1 family)
VSVGRLRVLLYHRIDDRGADQSDLNPDVITASPAQFERQLQHLNRFYHPVSAREVLAARAGTHTLPSSAVLVTFDDGYRDFKETAWPLLKKYRVPAVLFLPTAFVDGTPHVFWADALWQLVWRTSWMQLEVPGLGQRRLDTPQHRLETFRELVDLLKAGPPRGRREGLTRLAEVLDVQPEPVRAFLTWPELRQLAADGAVVAGHSRTHERLDQLDEPALNQEVNGCRMDLARELGTCQPLFAYPYGNANAAAVRAVGAAGFTLGFTTVCGVSDLLSVHPGLIRRDDARASMGRFMLRLSEPLSRMRTFRHRYPPEMQLAC